MEDKSHLTVLSKDQLEKLIAETEEVMGSGNSESPKVNSDKYWLTSADRYEKIEATCANKELNTRLSNLNREIRNYARSSTEKERRDLSSFMIISAEDGEYVGKKRLGNGETLMTSRAGIHFHNERINSMADILSLTPNNRELYFDVSSYCFDIGVKGGRAISCIGPKAGNEVRDEYFNPLMIALGSGHVIEKMKTIEAKMRL